MRSDTTTPDLGDNLLECPLTRWDWEGIDLEEVREREGGEEGGEGVLLFVPMMR